MATATGDQTEQRGRASTDPSSEHTTVAEDGVTLALATWVIGGMFLDGYAHVYVIDTETEDFFTPWHGVFYAGFAALALWVGFIGYRRRRPAGSPLDWFPGPYRSAVLGLAVFAVGGLGDMVWHTVFGVEVGIDALLSPTHLILFVGGLLLLWTPLRASTARGDGSPWLAVGSLTLVTSLLVFLTQYLWLIPYPSFAQQRFDAAVGTGVGTVQLFLGSAMVTTAVLVGPLRLVARDWRLPGGSAALIWGVAAALEALAFSRTGWQIIVVVFGGLVHDLVSAATRSHSRSAVLAAFAGPAALFAGYLIMARVDGRIGWPPEIWGGLVIMAGFVGAGLALIEQAGRVAPLSEGSSVARTR